MRRLRPARLSNAALGGFTPEVLAWVAAVVTNGGTVSAARRDIVNQFILAEKAAGTWALTDDYWGLWAENAIQALTSLKQLRLATAVNSPTFTTDRDYAYNGTSNYLNTGFVPSTHAVAMTGTNLRIGVYERTNVASNGAAAGGFNFSTQGLTISPRLSGGFLSASLNSQTSGPGGDSITDSRGYSVGSRNGATAGDITAYKNGAVVVPYTPGTVSASLTTKPIFIGAVCNNSDVATNFRAASEGFLCAGASLSAAQELAQYNNIQAWATAVGAQV